MNRYQEVLSRAKEAHKVQAVIKFKIGKQIEGTRLTPLCKDIGMTSSKNKPYYIFRCECGVKKVIYYGYIMRRDGKLVQHPIRSCGCLRKDVLAEVSRKSPRHFSCNRDSNGRFAKKLSWDGNNT